MSLSAAGLAQIAYEASRAYCQVMGDNSAPDWTLGTPTQQQAVIDAVNAILSGKVTGPDEGHDTRTISKSAPPAAPWDWGVNPLAPKVISKTSVYGVSVLQQRVQDKVFFETVIALRDLGA